MPSQEWRSTFETAILWKRLPYWLYWPVIAVIVLLVLELLTRGVGDEMDLGTRVVVLILSLPSVIIPLIRSFVFTMQSMSHLLWDDRAKFEDWMRLRRMRMFTLQAWPAKLVTGAVVGGALLSVGLMRGLPYDHPLSTCVIMVALGVVAWMCGQTLYICIELLVALYEVTSRPLIIPFFFPPIRALSPLFNYYSIVSMTVLIYYALLVLAVWLGPFGFHYVLMVWLTLLALVPLSFLLLSSYMTHRLMVSAKDANLRRINLEVQKAVDSIAPLATPETVERLEQVMTVQEKVQAMKEWPTNLGGTMALLVTLTAAIVQIAVAVAGLR